MKILQVMAGAKHGGAETAFVDMCLALHEAGQTIEIVTRDNAVRLPILEKAGIPVHTLPFGGGIDQYTPWKMKRIIRRFRPDIVQTWMARGCAKTPRWYSSMGVPPYKVVARLGGYYKLKYFKSADYFTTITPDIRAYLIREGVAPDTIRHINNFAETEAIETPVSRADYATPEDAPLLLALGRLHPSKAFDTLIRAVADAPGVHLWIAGEGPQRAELESLIREAKVSDRIKLLGWRTDRAALLAACDICVFPSRYEPFGTVFVQAWAAGRPVIASNADGPRQFVRDGEDGLIVAVDDVSALTAAITRLSSDQALRGRLSAAGRQRYLAEFTKEKAVAAYLDFYGEIRTNPPKTA